MKKYRAILMVPMEIVVVANDITTAEMFVDAARAQLMATKTLSRPPVAGVDDDADPNEKGEFDVAPDILAIHEVADG